MPVNPVNKPDLILLHGALGSSAQFKGLKPFLEKDYTLWTLDFSGHGGRPYGPVFNMEEFAKNINDFITENKLNKPDIFGYSMGGYAALKLALDEGDRLAKIVTLGTKFDWTVESAAKEVKMLNPDIIEEKVPKFAAYLKALHAPNDWRVLLQKTADMMLALGAGEALKTDDLANISNPVCIMVSDADNMVSADESAWSANALPNAEFKILSEVVHPLEKNDPQQLAEAILSSLQI